MDHKDFNYDDFVGREFGEGEEDEGGCPIHDVPSPLYEIVHKFIEAGLPYYRLPAPEQIISHLIECVDEKKLNAWIDAYVKLEKPKDKSESKQK